MKTSIFLACALRFGFTALKTIVHVPAVPERASLPAEVMAIDLPFAAKSAVSQSTSLSLDSNLNFHGPEEVKVKLWESVFSRPIVIPFSRSYSSLSILKTNGSCVKTGLLLAVI